MSLEPGVRLGPYEIVAPLGAGGMGEVYRARDARLKRNVAIKILPDAFTADAERIARFQREAQVLASLSHPNIGGFGPSESVCGRRVRCRNLVTPPGRTREPHHRDGRDACERPTREELVSSVVIVSVDCSTSTTWLREQVCARYRT